MTTKADRSELARAMAKAIAYRDCGKPDMAAKWAARLPSLTMKPSVAPCCSALCVKVARPMTHTDLRLATIAIASAALWTVWALILPL